jgi:hypothetical protein
VPKILCQEIRCHYKRRPHIDIRYYIIMRSNIFAIFLIRHFLTAAVIIIFRGWIFRVLLFLCTFKLFFSNNDHHWFRITVIFIFLRRGVIIVILLKTYLPLPNCEHFSMIRSEDISIVVHKKGSLMQVSTVDNEFTLINII